MGPNGIYFGVTQPSYPNQRKSNKVKTISIVVGVCLLLVAVIGGIFAFQNRKIDESDKILSILTKYSDDYNHLEQLVINAQEGEISFYDLFNQNNFLEIEKYFSAEESLRNELNEIKDEQINDIKDRLNEKSEYYQRLKRILSVLDIAYREGSTKELQEETVEADRNLTFLVKQFIEFIESGYDESDPEFYDFAQDEEIVQRLVMLYGKLEYDNGVTTGSMIRQKIANLEGDLNEQE